jgi:hypothetical protein
MVQEFNTASPPRQWVNETFGKEFDFMQETGMQLPNGIISRFPILESGSWDDPQLTNREFAWAKIRLPDKGELWAISVHLHSKGDASRATEAAALVNFIQKEVPENALLLIGGDFNTRTEGEPCLKEFAKVFTLPAQPPADKNGITNTNAPRSRPYDWVLASGALDKFSTPVKIAGQEFANGLVFDSRVFEPLDQVPPAQKGDSGVKNMQHMAVVRDFVIP